VKSLLKFLAGCPVRFLAGAVSLPLWGVSVTVTPSVTFPAPVGTAITWTASTDADALEWTWFRFRIQTPDGPYRIIQDYGPSGTLVWAARGEGHHDIEVSARDTRTGETVEVTAGFGITSLVGPDGPPLISATSHPLTLLYSAPPCAPGSRMSVEMVSPEQRRHATPPLYCQAGLSMNFYLSGMRAGAMYAVRHVVEDASGEVVAGPQMSVQLPAVTRALPVYTVLQRPPGPLRDGVILHSPIFLPPVATDLEGNIVWYYPDVLSFLTRPVAGGSFWGILQDYFAGPSRQIVREFDTVGLTLRETNAARVNEQLAAMGINPIGSFHHEALTTPDGNVLVLASTERILTDVQGPGPVDVIGDTILMLDRDMQVIWAWDAFDHLDATRQATMGEVCAPERPGCPPFYLASEGNDWLHGNSLQVLADGSILYSARHQDWVIRIEYPSGRVIWRLGKEGDFEIDSPDPDPWFSHQHDPQYHDGLLAIFDNSNLRRAADPFANSRGQVYRMDEENRRVSMALNSDLGDHSFALGSAQPLPGGNWHFDMGWLSNGTGWSMELDAAGNTVYVIQSSVPDYRSFSMTDLYRP
jgi:hypothetical protein